MFQVGNLVKYKANNKWKSQRNWLPEKENVGVVLSVSTFKDNHQDGVLVRWNGGTEKVYFEEELFLLSNA